MVSGIARNAFDEGKVIGTIGAGRIGYRVLERLQPFNCKEFRYYDYNALKAEAEKAVSARRVQFLKDPVSQCGVITINAFFHDGTRGLINADLLKHFKKGSWLVNTARGAICNAVAASIKAGHLNGYAGDVWNVQLAPQDYLWRYTRTPWRGLQRLSGVGDRDSRLHYVLVVRFADKLTRR